MKIRTIAFSTFGSFRRNKLIILFCSIFLCIVLLMMTPLLAYKSMINTANAQQMRGMILNEVTAVMSMVSAFGSLLAGVPCRKISRCPHAYGGLCTRHVWGDAADGVDRRPAFPHVNLDFVGLSHGALCHLGGDLDVSGNCTAPTFCYGHRFIPGDIDPDFWLYLQIDSQLGPSAGAPVPAVDQPAL